MSAVLYKRLLADFNFTIYVLNTKDCYCFNWHEGKSKLGSTEIQSCLYGLLTKLYDINNDKTVHLFSEECAGQNKTASYLPCCIILFLTVRVLRKSLYDFC